MTDYAELELSLNRRDADSYGIELRFTRPNDEADVRIARPGPNIAALATNTLAGLDPDAYGLALGQQLFADGDILAALRTAQSTGFPLRLRLFIGPSAPELHGVRWELMRVTPDEPVLSTSENTLFSRYLSSTDWRPVRLRPEGKLTALIVIADPPGLPDYGLAAVAVDAELNHIRTNLGDAIARQELVDADATTLNGIISAVRGGVDILYLVAHGLLLDGTPTLFLTGPDGQVALVPGAELVTRLQELEERPRLVVLASCQSASNDGVLTTTDNGVLAALGPRLAAVGIPAVVAMQGNVQMETMAKLLPIFFQELHQDGRVDRAMAVARAAIREQPDWWAPTLYMRLRNGRIWYTPGFSGQSSELEQWKSLVRNIERGKCTPIIGPGLTESLLGTRRQIARGWADTFNFPMAPHEREDLPQVTQFMAVNHGESFARDELTDYLRNELQKHISIDASIPEERALLDAAADAALGDHSLSKLFSVAWKLQRLHQPAEPHWVLAQLPLPLYITTMPTNALFDALSDADIIRPDGSTVKKRPRVELCRWNEELEHLPSVRDDDPDYRPSPEEPLIYYLFGNLDEPGSVVLTEDDYFDFLIGVTSNKDLIPQFVRRYMVDSALLFLGFGLDEQDFRVLFRSIMKREGRRRRRGYAHVAAQINPEEGRILEPERARAYLETYFDDAAISIFWGSAHDFIGELQARMKKE